jgi:hypothetical protein
MASGATETLLTHHLESSSVEVSNNGIILDQEWPRRRSCDPLPIVHVSFRKSLLFPDVSSSDDDLLHSSRSTISSQIARVTPLDWLGHSSSSDHQQKNKTLLYRETKKASKKSGQTAPPTTTTTTATTKVVMSSFPCSHCGHEFGLRKTRDVHSKVCAVRNDKKCIPS